MARKTIKILYICHLENFTQHKIKAMATDDTLNNENQTSPVTDYNEGDIKTLDWKEHIRKANRSGCSAWNIVPVPVRFSCNGSSRKVFCSAGFPHKKVSIRSRHT